MVRVLLFQPMVSTFMAHFKGSKSDILARAMRGRAVQDPPLASIIHNSTTSIIVQCAQLFYKLLVRLRQ